MDKNIPLSELIRIGSKVTLQCNGSLYQPLRVHEVHVTHTCAIGAAYIAKFGHFAGPVGTGEALRACGVDPLTLVPEPVGMRGMRESGFSLPLISAITCMNDIGGWTRERIADWLQSIGL